MGTHNACNKLGTIADIIGSKKLMKPARWFKTNFFCLADSLFKANLRICLEYGVGSKRPLNTIFLCNMFFATSAKAFINPVGATLMSFLASLTEDLLKAQNKCAYRWISLGVFSGKMQSSGEKDNGFTMLGEHRITILETLRALNI